VLVVWVECIGLYSSRLHDHFEGGGGFYGKCHGAIIISSSVSPNKKPTHHTEAIK